MDNTKIFILSLLFLSAFKSLVAQDTIPDKNIGKKYCDPKLEGMARSKGFSILYERTLDSPITSESNDSLIGNGNATIRRNNKLDIKLRFPVINKPGIKMVIGLKYFFEEFNFETPEGLEYDLYKNLEDKNLKSIGGNINMLLPLNETTYLGFRSSADLNGDYSAKEFAKSSFLKYSFSGLYGWKNCPTRTIAIGLYYSYTFGRRSVYPVVLYNNTFNSKWGIEALVPANIKIRHNFSKKTLLYLGYEIDGAAYTLKIDNPPFSNYPSMELRRSNIKFTLDFEQEIHDWLWFGISAGVRHALGMNLAKEGGVRRDHLIENKLGIAPFFNASIFIVPPRTLENKILNTK
jgi:hypothetical protein